MRILVTGATGFVGSRLIPRLAAEGHELLALARDPAKLDVPQTHGPEAYVPGIHGPETHGPGTHAPAVTAVGGDVLTGAGLADALRDVEVAYYLIHSMERPAVEGPRSVTGRRRTTARTKLPTDPGHAKLPTSFAERERVGALRFAEAASAAGVRRIVYLGGPLPDSGSVSSHLRSRADVERILLDAVPDSVALRASIVIGAKSRSFRLLVRLVERMPVLTMPAWRRNRTQPVDERDIVEMLLAAANSPEASGMSLDAAGPEALTYEAILQRIAELMLLGRPTLPLGLNLTPLAARLTAAIVGEDPDLVLPLMESLSGDLLPHKESAAQILHVHLHSFDAAVEHALAEWEAVEPLAAR